MKYKINNTKIVLISWWTTFKDSLSVLLNTSFREYLMKKFRSWGLVLTYQQFLILSISPKSVAIVAQLYFESIHKSLCEFIYLLGYFKDTEQAQGSQNTDPKDAPGWIAAHTTSNILPTITWEIKNHQESLSYTSVFCVASHLNEEMVYLLKY